jgi:hypothetical protein
MGSEVTGILQWSEAVQTIQTSNVNTARFNRILVNRTGNLEHLYGNRCNVGYEIQCYSDGGNEGASSSFMILFVVVIIIGLMLVFALVYMCKKKKALEKKIEVLTSTSENINGFQD